MEKKTLAQELAENLNRNVLIDQLLDRPGASLEKYLRAMSLPALEELKATLNRMETDEPS